MTKPVEIRIPANEINVAGQIGASIAVVGNPNSGKSTLFNRLTGLKQRIGNYPGVTVERHVGTLRVDDVSIELVDLPGTHSLSAHSLEEHIAVDVIFGRMQGTRKPDGILAVLDATNLYQGLFLVQQLLELRLPTVVALTMTDAAEQSGIVIDTKLLSELLGGVPIYPVVATTGSGLAQLRQAIAVLPDLTPHERVVVWPELAQVAGDLADGARERIRFAELERLLIDGPTTANRLFLERLSETAQAKLEATRESLFGGEPPIAKDARIRYAWVRDVLLEVQKSAPRFYSWRTRITAFLNRPIPGTIGLFVVMAIVFQAVFAWATPLMDLIDGAAALLGAGVVATFGDGAFASLLADGVIAGVGSVV
ncbi:MAG: FeoB small GTPase domain-containing protein, partial [Woeseiaceae bacterium]